MSQSESNAIHEKLLVVRAQGRDEQAFHDLVTQVAMSETRPQRTRVEDVLAQDAVVSSFQFKEFRMNLEESIKRLEDRARLIYRAALGSLGIFIACVALAPLLTLISHDWIRWSWSGCGLAALFTTGVLTAIDHYKYRPALKRQKTRLGVDSDRPASARSRGTQEKAGVGNPNSRTAIVAHQGLSRTNVRHQRFVRHDATKL